MLTAKKIESTIKQACRGKLVDDVYLRDSGEFKGLALRVKPSGAAAWSWRYKNNATGQRKLIAFGGYPSISLAEAHQKFIYAKNRVVRGKPPVCKETLAEVAEQWFENEVSRGRWKPSCAPKKWSVIERHLLTLALASKPIQTIEAAEIYHTLNSIPGTGDTMHRVANFAETIFAYAIAIGLCDTNPAAMIKAALAAQKPSVPLAGLVERDDVANLLKRINSGGLQPMIRIALLMHAHIVLRNTELRASQWHEIDVSKKEWVVPAERMKKPENGDHWIPLTKPVIKLLEELRYITGEGDYLFPARNRRKNPYMCDRVCNEALKKLWPELRLTTHGFRDTLSTLANDSKKFDSDIIEAQLHHVDPNIIRRKYNRAQYREHRRKLLKWYSKELVGLAG